MKLPKRVYKTKTRYYFKTHDNKSITLGKINATESEIIDAYYKALGISQQKNTFEVLWRRFLDSEAFQELKPRTQQDYYQHQKKLLAVFGDVDPADIEPVDVRKYMDLRGVSSKTQANHEKASMSRVFRWGYERGYVKHNPCEGVKKFTMKPRDVYINDREYHCIIKHAQEPIKIAMELAYLCAMRLGDILNLKWHQITPEGIFIEQSKTGKKQIKAYTERLNNVMTLAMQLFPPKTGDSYVVLNTTTKKQYHKKTFNTHFLEAKHLAEKELGQTIAGTFHDIKAKSISDYDGTIQDKQFFSGHKTESQVLIYDRKVKLSPTLNLPVIPL